MYNDALGALDGAALKRLALVFNIHLGHDSVQDVCAALLACAAQCSLREFVVWMHKVPSVIVRCSPSVRSC